MSIYQLGNKLPTLAPGVWIAPNATVIGDVRLAENVSIWWNAVLRGAEVARIAHGAAHYVLNARHFQQRLKECA